jgi:hypothetical protein
MSKGQLITDAVLPLALVKKLANGTVAVEQMVGTGFIIGSPQRLVTARHVADRGNHIVGVHSRDGVWITVGLHDRRDHPAEDISLYSLQAPLECADWFTFTSEEQFGSGDYAAWGYPEDVFYDHHVSGMSGPVQIHPEIVYGSGHIRRRVSQPVPSLIGTAFLELSDTLGSGASGGPVIAKGRPYSGLRVIGVYVGERTTQTGDGVPRSVSYATRISSVTDWLREQGIQVLD